MPNQEQQREDKLREAAKSTFPINKPEDAIVPEYALTINAVWLSAYLEGAKSEAAKEYHRKPVDVEAIRAKFYKENPDLITTDDLWNFFLPHLQPSGESDGVKLLEWINKETRLGLLKLIDIGGVTGLAYTYKGVLTTEEQLYTEFLKHKQSK